LSSTTLTTPRVWLLRHVVRLVVDYFASAARPGASARRAACRRLLRLCHASGCFGTSRSTSSGLSLRLSSTTSPHASSSRPGASTRRAARRRLLGLRRASGCFGTSRGTSRGSSLCSSSTTSPRAGSSSTTSPTLHVLVPRHVARFVSSLAVDYFAYAARPGASARRTARHTVRRRLLRAP
jgi:hypothetical protein